jgi:hypothetical protein
MNQEFPTSIFFDGDRDMSNNGLPERWPDGSTRDRWHSDDNINNELRGSMMQGRGYYALTPEQKHDAATVYIQALWADTDKDGVKDTIGIQYWFYYVFHDDPGQQPHPHDWWYFWVWYNTETHSTQAHRPLGVVYDFHHNLRAMSFTDERVHRDGLHVRTYHDAGGHRVMYEKGGDVNLAWAGALIQPGEVVWSWGVFSLRRGGPYYSLWDMMENTDTHYYWLDLYEGDTCILPYAFVGYAPGAKIAAYDFTIGVMIKKLWRNGTIASWRGIPMSDTSISGYPIDTKIADWNEGQTWKVEEFPHWVWVYGVEPYNAFNDRVKFTGDNIYSGAMADIWPIKYSVGTEKIDTYLPWRTGISYFGITVISSTAMVWWYRQYDPTASERTNNFYDWYIYGLPTIFTRYYDGSP